MKNRGKKLRFLSGGASVEKFLNGEESEREEEMLFFVRFLAPHRIISRLEKRSANFAYYASSYIMYTGENWLIKLREGDIYRTQIDIKLIPCMCNLHSSFYTEIVITDGKKRVNRSRVKGTSFCGRFFRTIVIIVNFAKAKKKKII